MIGSNRSDREKIKQQSNAHKKRVASTSTSDVINVNVSSTASVDVPSHFVKCAAMALFTAFTVKSAAASIDVLSAAVMEGAALVFVSDAHHEEHRFLCGPSLNLTLRGSCVCFLSTFLLPSLKLKTRYQVHTLSNGMRFAPIVLSIKNFVALASSSPCLPNALTTHFKTFLHVRSAGILSSCLEWKIPLYKILSFLGGKLWMIKNSTSSRLFAPVAKGTKDIPFLMPSCCNSG